MSPVLFEGPRAAEYLQDEVSVNLSRKQVVVASGSGVIKAGTVMALNSSTGNYVPLAPGGSNGTGDAIGIVFDNVDATSADADAVITSGLAAVNGSLLIWPEGANEGQIAAATGQLEALNIAVLAADPIPSGS